MQPVTNNGCIFLKNGNKEKIAVRMVLSDFSQLYLLVFSDSLFNLKKHDKDG